MRAGTVYARCSAGCVRARMGVRSTLSRKNATCAKDTLRPAGAPDRSSRIQGQGSPEFLNHTVVREPLRAA